jgi:hypothetical protein
VLSPIPRALTARRSDNNPADLTATKPYWLIPVLSGVTALADILIAGVLCYFLRAERGDYNMWVAVGYVLRRSVD